MRYIDHRGSSSRDEFRAVLEDSQIPSLVRIELMRRLADIDGGRRAPDAFGTAQDSNPEFYVWISDPFDTEQGRRQIWLAYEHAGNGTTVLHVFATFTGGARQSEYALDVTVDRQRLGSRV
ncbi:hypothetical protein GR183_01700 [Stappia sp. GBMRC 2046]|uniref:Uncharacterized protein n=1 Tax=Stappia sediminis TaxID=2692190 RepID=A0A7X3LR78_9HYPH|nr:hypothetical protein [Stappia sediminis]MXN63604.1 hypothetical protein [Stappia sediminis]